MKKAYIVDILVSCPGDVEKGGYLDAINGAVSEFNGNFGYENNIVLRTLHWRKDVTPEHGESSQGIINKQIVDSSDAVIAVFKHSFGTPTEKYGSGTEEEIKRMIENQKPIFLYFINKSVNPEQVDLAQFEKIKTFKSEYKGIYSTVRSRDDLKKQLSSALYKYAREVLLSIDTIGQDIDAPVLSGAKNIFKNNPAGFIRNLGIDDMLYRNGWPNIPDDLFEKARLIRALFTSGPVFFREYREKLQLALENNAVIKVILATKQSEFVREVEEMHASHPRHKKVTKIDEEIESTENIFGAIREAAANGKIFISHFNTQLRGNVFMMDDSLAYYTPIIPPKTPGTTLSLALGSGALLKDFQLYFDTLYSILDKKGAVYEIN